MATYRDAVSWYMPVPYNHQVPYDTNYSLMFYRIFKRRFQRKFGYYPKSTYYGIQHLFRTPNHGMHRIASLRHLHGIRDKTLTPSGPRHHQGRTQGGVSDYANLPENITVMLDALITKLSQDSGDTKELLKQFLTDALGKGDDTRQDIANFFERVLAQTSKVEATIHHETHTTANNIADGIAQFNSIVSKALNDATSLAFYALQPAMFASIISASTMMGVLFSVLIPGHPFLGFLIGAILGAFCAYMWLPKGVTDALWNMSALKSVFTWLGTKLQFLTGLPKHLQDLMSKFFGLFKTAQPYPWVDPTALYHVDTEEMYSDWTSEPSTSGSTQALTSPTEMIRSIGEFFHFLVKGTFPDVSKFTKHLDKFFSLNRGIDSIAKLIEKLGAFFTWIIDYCRDPLEPVKAQKVTRITTWVLRVAELIADANTLHLAKTDSTLYDEIISLYKEGAVLINNISQQKNRSLMTAMLSVWNPFVTLHQQMSLFSVHKLYRKSPFVVELTGDTCVGKTTSLCSLFGATCDAIGLPPGMPRVYTRGDTKHWDQYAGEFITVFDDLIQMVEPTLLSEKVAGYMAAAGNAGYYVPQADIKDKGMMFSSNVILVTSNNAYPTNTGVVYSHEAFQRRRHLLFKVTIKEEYLTTFGTVDFSKVGDSLDYMQFTLIPSVEKYKCEDFRDKTFEETSDFIMQQYFKHDVAQARLVHKQRMRAFGYCDDFRDIHRYLFINQDNIVTIKPEFCPPTEQMPFAHSQRVSDFFAALTPEEQLSLITENAIPTEKKVWCPMTRTLKVVKSKINSVLSYVRQFNIKDYYNLIVAYCGGVFGVSREQVDEVIDQSPPESKMARLKTFISSHWKEIIASITGVTALAGIAYALVKCLRTDVPKQEQVLEVPECVDFVEAHPSGDEKTVKFRQAQRRVVTERPATGVTHSVTDKNAHDLMFKLIGNNIVYVILECANGTTRDAYGLALLDRKVILPGHVFADPVKRVYLKAMNLEHHEDFDPTRLTRILAQDQAIYTFGPRIRSFKNITNHFIQEADLSHLSTFKCMLPTYRQNHDSGKYVLTILSGKGNELAAQKSRDDEGRFYFINNGFEYNLESQPGDCGMPLILNNTAIPRKIMGIHVMGLDIGGGLSSVVTQESLQAAGVFVGDLNGGIDELVTIEEATGVPHARVDIKGHYTVLHVLDDDHAVFMPTKTSIRKSLIHGRIRAPVTEPAILSKYDPRNTAQISPLEQSFTKCATPPEDLDPLLLSEACQVVQNWTLSFPPLRKLNSLLDFQAVINGLPIEGYIGLHMQTSPGYPYILQRELKNKGKLAFFRQSENGTYTIINNKIVFDTIDLLHRAKRTSDLGVVFIDCLKDERRPLAKIREVKTRLFECGPLHYLLAMKIMFGDFAAAFQVARHTGYGQIGINVDGPEWTRLYNRLIRRGEVGFDLDYSNFDGSIHPEVIDRCGDMINAWYSQYETPKRLHTGKITDIDSYMEFTAFERQMIRRNLFRVLIHTPQIAMNVLYLKHRGNPSGQFLTSILNSMANCFYIYYAAFGALLENNPQFFSLAAIDNRPLAKRNILDCVVYGDDGIVVPNPQLAHVLNGCAFKRILSTIGLKITPALKGEGFSDLRPIEDLQFLKRSFKRAPFNNKVMMAPISRDTIYELTNWIRDSKFTDPKYQLQENCVNALRFAYSHDRSFFDELLFNIQRECVRFEIFDFPTFAALDLEYRSLFDLDIAPLDKPKFVIVNKTPHVLTERGTYIPLTFVEYGKANLHEEQRFDRDQRVPDYTKSGIISTSGFTTESSFPRNSEVTIDGPIYEIMTLQPDIVSPKYEVFYPHIHFDV